MVKSPYAHRQAAPLSPSATRRWETGTPEQFRWLEGILRAVVVLNLVDAILTLFWVHSGLAREANPLLEPMVNQRVVIFVAVKLSLVSSGVWLLWQRRQHPLAVVGLFVSFLLYYGVLLHHLRFAGLLIHRFLPYLA
jgi:hypothetical protein